MNLVIFLCCFPSTFAVVAGTSDADLEHQLEHVTENMAALNYHLESWKGTDLLLMHHLTSILEMLTSLLDRVDMCGPCNASTPFPSTNPTTTPNPSTTTPMPIPTPLTTTKAPQPGVSDTWRDEVAQGACSGLQEGAGWMFAVRRHCASIAATCAQICSSLAGEDSQATKMECVDALHVYKNTHPLERGLADDAPNTLGTKVHRYFSCTSTGCGPNFCCCKGN